MLNKESFVFQYLNYFCHILSIFRVQKCQYFMCHFDQICLFFLCHLNVLYAFTLNTVQTTFSIEENYGVMHLMIPLRKYIKCKIESTFSCWFRNNTATQKDST